ncbi:MAG: AAA family ATPase [Pseudomonadales bacterium]|nr:AAA family ATPase [Pseudomonadales bacterium]MCP5357423.1 AAA family ATPase [Pseudomonadales bacterium]
MQDRIQAAVDEIGQVLLGKEQQVRLAICCLLAGGHLLIEDLPGMGKTTLAHALARVFGLDFNRIQFTSDLLPADILGVSIFDQANTCFTFHAGPIFNQLILADEINRATPKTQSALLEAMEEGQVSVEGETRPLPSPFFVIATQNPVSLAGTFPLPESQLDRFLMRIGIGYPDPKAERELLERGMESDRGASVRRSLCLDDLIAMRKAANAVKLSPLLLDYVQRLIAYTRDNEHFHFGLSPRGSIAVVRAARTWAFMEGREHALPEDVQAVLPAVVEHRLRAGSDTEGRTGSALAHRLLSEVDVLQ